MHTARFRRFGVLRMNAKLFSVNTELSRIDRGLVRRA